MPSDLPPPPPPLHTHTPTKAQISLRLCAMRRLIWACVVCKLHKDPFRRLRCASYKDKLQRWHCRRTIKHIYNIHFYCSCSFWSRYIVRLLFRNVISCHSILSLRKHAYSNTLKILQPNKENFQIKYSDIFHTSAQNIDCGHTLKSTWRGSTTCNQYPQYMFLSRNKKNNVYPFKPQFYYVIVGFKGVKII